MSSSIFEKYQAQWVSFWPKPEQYRAPDYGQACEIYVGQVVGVHPLPNSERGNIPQADLTIRGRTKRELRVNSLDNHVRLHRTFTEAEERRKS